MESKASEDRWGVWVWVSRRTPFNSRHTGASMWAGDRLCRRRGVHFVLFQTMGYGMM